MCITVFWSLFNKKAFFEKEKLRKLDFNQLINFSKNGVFSDFNDNSQESAGGLTEPLG